MKRLSRTCVLFLLLLATAVPSFAGKTALPENVRELVQAYLEGEWGAGNVTWTASVPRRSLVLPEGAHWRVESVNKPRGNVLLNLTMVQGNQIVRRIPLSGRLMPFAWVPVAVNKLDRNTVIGENRIRWERREVTRVRDTWPISPSDLTSKEYWTRRRLKAGEIVLWSDIEPRPDVVRGDHVKLISQQGLVQIKTSGVALQDGKVGESIRVENPQYRAILKARVEGEGVVIVEGPAIPARKGR